MAIATDGQATATQHQVGRIVQVIGSTFDAEFEAGQLPEIYNALNIDAQHGILETAAQQPSVHEVR